VREESNVGAKVMAWDNKIVRLVQLEDRCFVDEIRESNLVMGCEMFQWRQYLLNLRERTRRNWVKEL
jgi:hypothetical protein